MANNYIKHKKKTNFLYLFDGLRRLLGINKIKYFSNQASFMGNPVLSEGNLQESKFRGLQLQERRQMSYSPQAQMPRTQLRRYQG